MKTVFADSFYFVASFNDQDRAHDRALQFAQSYKDRIITTEWVLMELGSAFAKPNWRPAFLAALETLRNDPRVTIVEATHELFDRAVKLFSNRPDKNWSLTDCASFLVMEDHGISEALTADHHFQQAGFTALLI